MYDSEDLIHGDHWADWTATDCPAMLIHGTKGIIPAEQIRAMVERRPSTASVDWRPITSSPPPPPMRSPPRSRRSSPRSRQPGLAPPSKRAEAGESVSDAASAPKAPLPA
ncbi:hypothetical protein [Streptomyces longwoodensis]|uniref:hypothetical protein n=1 Tax=Streptomyces longwoodensis TaxID=68231 RepID=UPI0033DACE76